MSMSMENFGHKTLFDQPVLTWEAKLVETAKRFAAELAAEGMYEQADTVYAMINEAENVS